MKKARVYKIVNSVTDDIYIGSTVQELKDRFKSHKSNARLNKINRLYDCMRLHGIEKFSIELLYETDFVNKQELTEKEKEYYVLLEPSLNIIVPRIIAIKQIGRIYKIYDIENNDKFYIGSTSVSINERFSNHISASRNGSTPLYTYIRERGKNNFKIEMIEDDIPYENLIEKENFWLQKLKPSLNKNLFLCRTEKERDKYKYEKNKEKIKERVNTRRILKRDEINVQKVEYYEKNKEEINSKRREKYEKNKDEINAKRREKKLENKNKVN